MDAKFVVRSGLDRDACLAMARHQLKPVKLAFFLVDAVVIALAAMLLRSGSQHAGIVCVFAVVLVLYSLALDQIAGRMMFRAANKAVGVTQYDFGPEDIHAKNRQEETRLRYDGFVKFHETDRHFFLFLRRNSALVLAKRGFAAGKPEDFAAFFAQKSGLPVKRSRT